MLACVKSSMHLVMLCDPNTCIDKVCGILCFVLLPKTRSVANRNRETHKQNPRLINVKVQAIFVRVTRRARGEMLRYRKTSQ